MIINKPYTNKQYADLSCYCNENDCHIEDKGDYLESVLNEHPAPSEEEQRENRARAYKEEVDPLHSRKQRKIILEEWTEDDEREYILKVKELSDKIAKEYPYPEGEDEPNPIS